MSCFYFCFFLLIFVFKVLGYLSAQIKNKAHVETNVSANFIPRRFDKSV